MEADLAEVLVPAANDARPELVLEPLPVLWAERQPDLIAVGKVLTLRRKGVLALLLGAVAVAVPQVHQWVDLEFAGQLNDRPAGILRSDSWST